MIDVHEGCPEKEFFEWRARQVRRLEHDQSLIQNQLDVIESDPGALTVTKEEVLRYFSLNERTIEVYKAAKPLAEDAERCAGAVGIISPDGSIESVCGALAIYMSPEVIVEQPNTRRTETT